jgi:hypothetical protein
MTLREQFYAELYRGYLTRTPQQLEDLEAGFELTANAVWPANEEVVRLCPHDDAVSVLPCLAIVATEAKHKHPLIVEMEVFVRLQIAAQINEGDEDAEYAGTAMVTAQAWLQAINEAIHATETFRAYLLTLSEAERAGSEMILRMVDNGVVHVHEEGTRTHTWEIKIAHKIDVSPEDV